MAKTSDKNAKVKSELFDWLDSIFISLAFLICVFNFFIVIVQVDGESMENTLHHGDKMIISNMFYSPKPGDIVVVERDNNMPIVKRVIATEGQEVDINFYTGQVTIDGKRMIEPYIKEPTNSQFDVEFPIKIPENSYFIMGDNRNNSMDSRYSEIGMVKRDHIIGKVIVRFFPFDKIGIVE